MDHDYYFGRLYPLQDRTLHAFNSTETGFYLSGGTAASRGYLQHRLSDDLDLFVNDAPNFVLWAQRLIGALLPDPSLTVDVQVRDERFVRFTVSQHDVRLKVELINDVPSHVGALRQDPTLGTIDSAENILANKVTAVLDRQEPKDLADIWGFTALRGLSLDDAITGAQSKAAGVFPADLARVLLSSNADDWSLIRWIVAPTVDRFLADLHALGERLILPAGR